MLEVDELSYAAIITIELPGMSRPATVTVALRPPDAIEVAPGQVKALRDCSLADLEAFAEALEAELWSQYQAARLSEIAVNDQARLKITVLNETGDRLALDDAAILEHAIVLEETKPAAERATDQEDEATADAEPEQVEEPVEEAPASETEEAPTSEATEAPAADTDAAGTPAVEGAADAVEELAPDDAVQTDEAAPEVEREQAAEPAEASAAEDAVEAEAEPRAPAEAIPAPPPGRMRIAGLRRPLGHPTSAAADILVNEPAFRDAQAHALSSANREVAGMLVGPRPEKQPDGRYVVHVTDVIIAKHTRMHGASVTYTPESWRYVSDKLNERYPNEEAVIVGWYHTHPGFGIFLSGMDLFIHQHFFTQKWHVALVLDPLAQRSGFFCWDRGQTGVHPYDFPWPAWAAQSW